MMLQMMLQMILPFKRQNCELVIITKEDWWFAGAKFLLHRN